MYSLLLSFLIPGSIEYAFCQEHPENNICQAEVVQVCVENSTIKDRLSSLAEKHNIALIFEDIVCTASDSNTGADVDPVTDSGSTEAADSYASQAIISGTKFSDCVADLNAQGSGWCEIKVSDETPSISSVWPTDLTTEQRMVTGPQSVLTAWNGAAFDKVNRDLYFHGGGHNNYGGNEVYKFDIDQSAWYRLTDPSPLDHLFVRFDYNERADKPWRMLCWIPDATRVPISTHNYDSLFYSHKTGTIFTNSEGNLSTGACFEDEADQYANSDLILGPVYLFGWYEFNPTTEAKNGLAPLSWRRVLDRISPRARSEELPDQSVLLGSYATLFLSDPANMSDYTLTQFLSNNKAGDGNVVYDSVRNVLWAVHLKYIFKFDAGTGALIGTYSTAGETGRSLAISNDGSMLSWNGTNRILQFIPDESDPHWIEYDWGLGGPQKGDNRVYSKWVYLPDEDVFVGISEHTTGVWVYKHDHSMEGVRFADMPAQQYIDSAIAGSDVTIPKGLYPGGLFIDKSLSVKMSGAKLSGVSNSKGVVNVKCDNCSIVLDGLKTDGNYTGCISGNCAGIKMEGVNPSLTVVGAHIKNTPNGILTDNRGGYLVIEDSAIEGSGLSGFEHGVYAGKIDTLIIRNTTIQDINGDGHILKSRAPDTTIENSFLVGRHGFHSRVLDLPCGGVLNIRNSILQQSDNTDNSDLISVGVEINNCGSISPSSVSISDTWIIFDRDQSSDERSRTYGPNTLFKWYAPKPISISMKGNKIIDPTGRLIAGKAIDGSVIDYDLTSNSYIYGSREEAGLSVFVPPLMMH